MRFAAVRAATGYAVFMVVASALAACSGSGSGPIENTYPVTPGHVRHEVVIGRGRAGAETWLLRASVNPEGQLCMGIRWRPYAGGQEFGCGFGNWHLDKWGLGIWPVETAQADSVTIAYAPSPAGAVRARLRMLSVPASAPAAPSAAASSLSADLPGCRATAMTPRTVMIAHKLPAWYPIRGAGWLVARVPAAAAECPLDVTFTDSHGRPVAEPRNF